MAMRKSEMKNRLMGAVGTVSCYQGFVLSCFQNSRKIRAGIYAGTNAVIL